MTFQFCQKKIQPEVRNIAFRQLFQGKFDCLLLFFKVVFVPKISICYLQIYCICIIGFVLGSQGRRDASGCTLSLMVRCGNTENKRKKLCLFHIVWNSY